MPESVRRWAYWSSVRVEMVRCITDGGDVDGTRTLVHELSETVVVLDEVIEPLLNLLGIPEEGFALCEGLVLLLHAVEEGLKPSEPEFEREFRSDCWGCLQRRWLFRWHELLG